MSPDSQAEWQHKGLGYPSTTEANEATAPQIAAHSPSDNSKTTSGGRVRVYEGHPPDRTPGRHFTRAFCINGGSGGASKLILKDTCRKPKTSMEVKFTIYFPILRTLLVKYVIDTI